VLKAEALRQGVAQLHVVVLAQVETEAPSQVTETPPQLAEVPPQVELPPQVEEALQKVEAMSQLAVAQL
jgi:hypothetical protein